MFCVTRRRAGPGAECMSQVADQQGIRPVSVLAGLLSYLVPGLGQISQGRVGKGVLFMVSLLGMFFFGMYLGDWKNVYVPPDVKENGLVCSFLSRGLLKDVPGRRFVCS